ncbi:hypothetical protein FJ365_05805 [Candidatus Dependentiae bacterium]|nr:hypothetical protein [Candidatus Dependentiae bacterium]
MKRLVLSLVRVSFMCFFISTIGRAENTPPQPADKASPQVPISLPGPDTSGPTEKIGTQGNWVKKREWLMKAHEAFTEVQDLVNQIEQIRSIFVEKLNNTNSILNNYYNSLGLAEGKVNELFNSIMDYLEHNRKTALAALPTGKGEHDIELQAKVDIIESNIKHQRLALDQLKLDMKTVEDLGKSLVERVSRVDEHITIVQGLFTTAQTNINELWDIIDHNKARDKYYDIKITLLEKMKAEQLYLQTDLLQDFDTVTQTIVSQIGRTEEAIKKIESDGFFIKNRSKRIKELKLKDVLLQNQATTATKPATAQEDVQQIIIERTLTQRLYQTGVQIMAWLIEKWSWFKRLIFGSSTSKPTITKTLHKVPAEQSSQASGPVIPTTARAPTVPSLPVTVSPNSPQPGVRATLTDPAAAIPIIPTT